MERLGYQHPTPIQQATAEPIRSGSNLFAGAKTGSGKTIAFLAPLCERLFANEVKVALVLAPTRELALQIDEEAMSILEGQTEVVSVPLYGGVPTDPQILAIKHHRPRILIATPGRFLDLVQEGCIALPNIEVAVLDEADRMCDMGFAPQVTQILDLLPNKKQMLLFSATLPKELNEIMHKFCPDPTRIQVDASDESSETIEHELHYVSRRDKIRKLEELISGPDTVALVFTKTRNRADELHRALERDIKGIGIIHAGYSMPERERTLRDYREGKIRILIATDVVSRGIDVDRITHVIHYDLPDALEDYIHRSGRSGRAGRAGVTIALAERDSRDASFKIKELSKKVKFKVFGEQPTEGDYSESHQGRGRGGRGRQGRPQQGERGGRSGGGGRDHRSAEGGSSSSGESRGPSRSHRGGGRGEHPRRERSHSQHSGGHKKSHSGSGHGHGPATKAKSPKSESFISKTKRFFSKVFGS